MKILINCRQHQTIRHCSGSREHILCFMHKPSLAQNVGIVANLVFFIRDEQMLSYKLSSSYLIWFHMGPMLSVSITILFDYISALIAVEAECFVSPYYK